MQKENDESNQLSKKSEREGRGEEEENAESVH